MQKLALCALVVADYDEAIAYYTGSLGFRLDEDCAMGDGKRWVVVTPPGSAAGLLLARASDDRQQAAIGNQTGGRVAFFLHTDDFGRDHRAMLAKGVHFVEEPRDEDYGRVAVFTDLYGNKWDLIEPARQDKRTG